MDLTIKIINDKELLQLFNELNNVTQNRIIQSGLKEAAKPILQQAKQNFEIRKKNKSKTNYANINSFFKIESNRLKDGVKIGVKNYYKARWIEWGTAERFYITKKNKVKHNTGKITATHFFYDAVNTRKDEAQRNINNYIIKALNQTISKYSKF